MATQDPNIERVKPVPGTQQYEFVSERLGAESSERQGAPINRNWVCEPAANYAFLDVEDAFLEPVQDSHNNNLPPINTKDITSRGPEAIHIHLSAVPHRPTGHATIIVKLHCKIVQIGGAASDPPPNPLGRSFLA
jgi:hypothetical protein